MKVANRKIYIDYEDYIYFKDRANNLSSLFRECIYDFLEDEWDFNDIPEMSGKIQRVSVRLPIQVWEEALAKRDELSIKNLEVIITKYLRRKK